MQSEFENLLLDTQKEYSRSNRMKDKIIIVLIVLMFLEALIGYCGFVWYESQFDYVTTEQTTQDVDLSTEGENADEDWQNVLRIWSVKTLLFCCNSLEILNVYFSYIS